MTLGNHVSSLRSLGFDDRSIETFASTWKLLQDEGYEMYGMYTGTDGSALQGKAACIVCSKKSFPLRWEKVITPSQDSAAVYTVCTDCDAEYVDVALRQKALGRLLKERNTRPG